MSTRFALVIGVMVLSLNAAGCTQILWALADPSGWGYVDRKGGPEQIGNWALRQRDMRRVYDAQMALTRYVRSDSPAERLAAIEAYRRMDEKLAKGWGDQYAPDDPEILRARQRIRNTFRAACREGIEEACEAELLLEPLEDADEG